MLMPSIFGENLFDDWMDFPFEREFFGRRNPLYGKNEKNLMKTDAKCTITSRRRHRRTQNTDRRRLSLRPVKLHAA